MNGLGVDFAGMERAALSTALTQVVALYTNVDQDEIVRLCYGRWLTDLIHAVKVMKKGHSFQVKILNHRLKQV